MILHKKIESPHDFDLLFPGTLVYLHGFPNQIFCVNSCKELFKSSDSPSVTIMTIDSKGRPHMLTVSPYCLVLPAEDESEKI